MAKCDTERAALELACKIVEEAEDDVNEANATLAAAQELKFAAEENLAKCEQGKHERATKEPVQ